LRSIREEIDAAVICVSPEKVELILREAAAIELRSIWLQKSAGSKKKREPWK